MAITVVLRHLPHYARCADVLEKTCDDSDFALPQIVYYGYGLDLRWHASLPCKAYFDYFELALQTRLVHVLQLAQPVVSQARLFRRVSSQLVNIATASW